MNIAETAAQLQTIQQAMILIHQSPDGDCIGSGYALAALLRQMGCHTVVCITGAMCFCVACGRDVQISAYSQEKASVELELGVEAQDIGQRLQAVLELVLQRGPCPITRSVTMLLLTFLPEPSKEKSAM